MADRQHRRMQHLVSKGYQRNFSADGTWVSVIDAASGDVLASRKSIGSNWREPDFLTVRRSADELDDSLEREFAQWERVVLNRVRDITPDRGLSAENKDALDTLTAMHLVRSNAFRNEHDTLVSRATTGTATRLVQDPTLLALFVAERGGPPVPDELENLVRRHAEEFAQAPDRRPEGVRRGVDGLHRLFGGLRVQLIVVNESLPGLVLPDHPVLHGNRSTGRFGFRDAGAVGDADTVLVPIRRHLAACYTRRRTRTAVINTKAGLLWINALLVRAAARELACHPDDAQATSRLIRNLYRYPTSKFNDKLLR